MRTSADIFTAPDTLPIGIKRTQRHEEVHVGARKNLAVEGAPVQAWRRLLKRAGSGADFGVVCWLDTSASVAHGAVVENTARKRDNGCRRDTGCATELGAPLEAGTLAFV